MFCFVVHPAIVTATTAQAGSNGGLVLGTSAPTYANDNNIGQYMTTFANITSGTNSDHLLRLLFTSGLEDILQIDSDKLKSTKVFLNERLVGYTKRPYFMNKKLKLLKPGKGTEIHITDAIQQLINDKEKFVAHTFEGKYLDCGTMKGYINSSKEIGKL